MTSRTQERDDELIAWLNEQGGAAMIPSIPRWWKRQYGDKVPPNFSLAQLKRLVRRGVLVGGTLKMSSWGVGETDHKWGGPEHYTMYDITYYYVRLPEATPLIPEITGR